MVKETASASENADVNVEGTRSVAKSPCARRHAHDDRGHLADGHGGLDHGAPPVSSFHHRLRPFSVCHHHEHRIHLFFDVYRLHHPSFVCHCRRFRRCRRDSFAVCPAPSILGGPGTRRVIHGLRCVGSQPCHRDDCDTCPCRQCHGISCASLVKESVVALSKRKWLM